MARYLIGGVIGLLLGGLFMTFAVGAMVGAGAGAGIAVGLSAGVCTTVRAAQDLDIMTPEQVDEVLTLATRNFESAVELEEGTEIVGSAAQCDEVLQRLRTAAAE